MLFYFSFSSWTLRGVRRTSWTRRFVARVTVPSKSPQMNLSPTLGRRLSFSWTRPPMATASMSSSSLMPSSSAVSSTLALPEISQLPSDCWRTSSTTSSCSSQISPTSSSRISSSVMMPAVPPYSSTTTPNSS